MSSKRAVTRELASLLDSANHAPGDRRVRAWTASIAVILPLFGMLLTGQTLADDKNRFCSLMRDLYTTTLATFAPLATGKLNDTKLADAVAHSVQAYIAQSEALQTTAPEAIKADVLTVLTAHRAFADGNQSALETAGVVDANFRMEDWLEKNCALKFTED